MNSNVWNRIILLSTLTSSFFLFFAFLSVITFPIRGYELSIYSDTPTIFWIAIIFGLINGLFLISADLYEKSNNIGIRGLFLIILCNSLVITLYALRGYVLYFGRGDVSTLVGMAKDINLYGNFGSNFYPITSILISQLSQLMNMPIIIISKYLSPFYFIFYVLSIYCWSNSIMADRKFILSSIMASLPIFFAWYSTSIYHNVLSVFTLPFFLFLIQKKSDYRFIIISIFYLIMYPLFHPITSTVIILYLFVFFILEKYVFNKKTKTRSSSLLLLSITSLTIWFIHQYVILRNIKSILLQLIGVLNNPTTFDQALYYGNRLGFKNTVKIIGFMLTDEIIFYFLSLYTIYLFYKEKKIFKTHKIFTISTCFLVGSIFLLFLFYSTRLHSPYRIINLNFNIIFTPIFVGYLVYYYLINKNRIKALLVIILILISTLASVFSLYPSPITMRPNQQVTNYDVIGMDWLIKYKILNIKTTDISSPIYRFADLIYGYEFRLQRPDLLESWKLQAHFGLNGYDVFPIDENRYLILTKFDAEPYIQELWKDIDHAYNKEDFNKINLCNNINKIYENGEFRGYLVYK